MTGAQGVNDRFSVINPVYFLNEETPAHSLTFIEDENDGYLLCGTENGCISIWDLRSLRLGDPTALCAGPSQCISMNHCGQNLLTQYKTGLIICWKKRGTSNWTEVSRIKSDYCGFCKLDVNNELNLIAFPFKDHSIHVYNCELKFISALETNEVNNKLGFVMCCKFVKCNGQYCLLVAYENGQLILWDLETRQAVSTLNLCKSPLFSLDFDNSKSQGVCGTNSKKLLVFKLNESLSLSCVHTIKLKSAGVGVVKIQPVKEIVAVGCWDSMIRIYSWTSFRLLAVLSFHSQSIEDICFSSKKCEVLDCECVLFATSRDKKISLWNVSEFCSPV